MIKGYKNLAEMPIEEFKAYLREIKLKALHIQPTGMGRATPPKVKVRKERGSIYSSHRAYFK